MTFQKILRFLFSWIFRLIYRVKSVNNEYMPESGGVIVCSNHISLLDPLFNMMSLKRPVHYMAKAEIFKIPVIRWFFKAVGCFPVNRGGFDLKSIKHSVKLLGDGEMLGIFPQGTRCPGREPSIDDVKAGVGLIEQKSRAVILPSAIITKDNRLKLFRKLTVVYGKPIEFSEIDFISQNESLSDKEKNVQISRYVFDKIIEIKNEYQAAAGR